MEREKAELKEKYEQALAQIQKAKDDLEEARQEAENVNTFLAIFLASIKESHSIQEIFIFFFFPFQEIQKWKTEVYSVRSELKAVETANNALKTQLTAANERAESLNKTVNDQNGKIRDCKYFILKS